MMMMMMLMMMPLLRWDSMGVLGLVCRLYSERDETKEHKVKKEEKEKENDKNSVKKDNDEPRCRYIKIELEDDNESDESPVHESNDEQDFLTEDENEYYWD